MITVFIDGQEGTTGLEIHGRLKARRDVTLLEIDPARRKDEDARRALIREADVLVTCLPDAAAIQSCELATERTRILDPSTAHRVASGWTYGFPELEPGQRQAICEARRVAVPGCHATGFLAAVRPLVREGILPADAAIVAHSLTGYSGAGKKAIALYEADRTAGDRLACPRPYALGLTHKHVPEMTKYAGLEHAPLFEPVIADFYRGMLVSVPLFRRQLAKAVGPADVREVLARAYESERFVRVAPFDAETNTDGGFLSPLDCNGTNRLDLFVFGHAEQILVVARLDNLGKGASGAAVQNLNLMMGLDEAEGLA